MIILENEKLNLKISEKGAEIVECTDKNGKNIIWTGNPEFWSKHAPVLFPICGRLLENHYTYGENTYNCNIHGFASDSVFTLLKSDNTSASFLLSDSDESRKIYPFAFELIVKYTLSGGRVTITYTVNNTDDKDILFSIGAHEGYMCSVFEDCYLEFDTPQTLKTECLSGGYLNGENMPVIENKTILELNSSDYPSHDLIFKDIDFSAVTLRDKNGEKIVRTEFGGFKNLLIWSLPNAPYVCIEPWYGLPDYTFHNGKFEDKAGLVHLKPNEKFEISHSFEI